MEMLLLGYTTFMTYVGARALKKQIDPMYYLESFQFPSSSNMCKPQNYREKKDGETSLEYIKNISQNKQEYINTLKCHLYN